jgi:adenosylcobinamide-GDP ribazoletransferase
MSLRYSLCFFRWWGFSWARSRFGWLYLAAWLGLGAILTGAVGCAIPLIVTGGIHMDGFMDSLDALSSHRPREEMLRILKDSHAGPSRRWLRTVLILDAAALSEMPFKAAAVLSGGFVLSAPTARFDGAPARRAGGRHGRLGQERRRGAGRDGDHDWSVGWITVFRAAMLLYAPLLDADRTGLVAVAVFAYLRVARRFGGVTGDLAGWFLQVCELGIALGSRWGGSCCEDLRGGCFRARRSWRSGRPGASQGREPGGGAHHPGHRPVSRTARGADPGGARALARELMEKNPDCVVVCDEVGMAWCRWRRRGDCGGRPWARPCACSPRRPIR